MTHIIRPIPSGWDRGQAWSTQLIASNELRASAEPYVRSDLLVQGEKVMLGWKAPGSPVLSPEGMIPEAQSMTVFRYLFKILK